MALSQTEGDFLVLHDDLACEEGVECVYISNHGGRQLDHCRGSTDVLPEVVSAVAGRAKVIVDGGFNRGADIQALALGADMVGIGRIYCYGLIAAGSEGIIRVLERLEDEITECLGLLGVTSIGELSKRHVCKGDPVYPAHLHSAFPLMQLQQVFY
jgi:isopentenyl diphosphate isomerase/L-lactate dehydrogenase-like FMN-dependent dehydrogenase